MNAMWTKLDAAVIGFFNPLASDASVRAAVRNDWPLHRLDYAIYIAAIYVTFVVGCKLLLDTGTRPAEREKKAKVSVKNKIAKEGVVLFGAMTIYNTTQVALCGWMVYAAIVEHSRRGLRLTCNVHDLAEDGIAFVLHVFYLSKVLDFADTLFMIVKGNWRQVSFLHVYHHTSIFLVYWLNANANYDGDVYFTVVLNGFIHFVMYGYYLATSFNVVVPVFIKKSITNAQLIQFCCMEAQGTWLLLNSCESPRNVTILYMVYISTMLVLFLDFKRRTYNTKPRSKQAVTKMAVDGCDSDVSTAASATDVMECCGWTVEPAECCGWFTGSSQVQAIVENKSRKAAAAAANAVVAARDVCSSAPQSRKEILVDGLLYDTIGFKHPGGSIVKFFQGGGDATAAWNQFHMRSKKAVKMLANLPSRPCPPASASCVVSGNKELEEDFKKFSEQLKAEGFFKPSARHVAYRVAELFVMFAVGLYLFACNSSSCWWVGGAVILGLAEGRCGWLMHEGGHGSLTGNIKIDQHLQVWIYGVGCGMSGGWWRCQHNKHHACPQKMKHDADLDTLPLVAFNIACLERIRSPLVLKWLQMQAVAFIPVTCFLVVLSWQAVLHPRYILRTSKWSEMMALLLRYYGIFFVILANSAWTSAIGWYFFVQQVAGAYIFTNFSLSHTHLDVTQADQHIHWVDYAAKHTTNIVDHWFVNWWMAYLNFQIEHHLFPAMPQFHHPSISPRVKDFFEKHGLVYDRRGYFSALGDTLKNLHNVGWRGAPKKDSRAKRD